MCGRNAFVTLTIPNWFIFAAVSNCCTVVSSMSPKKFKAALFTNSHNSGVIITQIENLSIY